MWFIT